MRRSFKAAALSSSIKNKESVFQTVDSHCDHTGEVESSEGAECNNHHIFSFQIISSDFAIAEISSSDYSIHFSCRKSSIFIKSLKRHLVNLHNFYVLTAFLQVFIRNFHPSQKQKFKMNRALFKLSLGLRLGLVQPFILNFPLNEISFWCPRWAHMGPY